MFSFERILGLPILHVAMIDVHQTKTLSDISTLSRSSKNHQAVRGYIKLMSLVGVGGETF